MRTLILLLALAASASAAAQSSGGELLERLKSPARTTPEQCARRVAEAARSNGPDLLRGAVVCYGAKRLEEGNFLLNAGQVRSAVDMVLMLPASKADSDAQALLYGVLFFHAGGPGHEDVLRQAPSRDRFFTLFDRWSPEYGPAYNPGWKARRRPDSAEYRTALADYKAGRRRQLADLSRLYSDDEYYQLHRRLNAILARSDGGLVEGSADAGLADSLLLKMEARSAALGIATGFAVEGGGPGSEPFPPAAPAADETVLAESTDPLVQRCADVAETMVIASGSKVLGVLVSRSPEWGIVWRADLGLPGKPAERFTCSERATATRPLDMGDEVIPPLPGGRPPAQPK